MTHERTHRCPRPGCDVRVPDYLFACRADWFALSPETRRLVYATSTLPVMHPRRREAFRAAEADWQQATPIPRRVSPEASERALRLRQEEP